MDNDLAPIKPAASTIKDHPQLSPANEILQKYLTSSTFLPSNVWKIAFSPCSRYLAIPKQDIYGRDCIVVAYCSNWHSTADADQVQIHAEFICSPSVWSLAFGQRQVKDNRELPENTLTTPLTSPDSTRGRVGSLSTVNRRFDLTKNLFLAAGLADGKIKIWNVDTKELTLILTDHRSTVCGLSFTASTMQLASCSHDTTIKLWDLFDDGNMYKTLNEWTHVINAAKWSPNERLLCAVGPHELAVLYDTATWKQLFRLDGHLNNVADCNFSSDSALVATACYDTRVLLWSTITGELIRELLHQFPRPLAIYAGGENDSFVRSVLFTRFDQHLISACDDHKLRWFSTERIGRSQAVCHRMQSNMLCLALTLDGRTLAVGTRTGEVHLWSTLACSCPSLKSCCRATINSQRGSKRRQIRQMFLSSHLINYLMYKDDTIK